MRPLPARKWAHRRASARIHRPASINCRLCAPIYWSVGGAAHRYGAASWVAPRRRAGPRYSEAVRYEYEVSCEACGNRWRVVVEFDVELEQAECQACGADTVDLTEIGRHFEP
jgi:hypothetical protein